MTKKRTFLSKVIIFLFFLWRDKGRAILKVDKYNRSELVILQPIIVAQLASLGVFKGSAIVIQKRD